MYNETSCRMCGWELLALLRCKFCEETNSWICEKCGKTIQRFHTHNLQHLSTMTSVNTIRTI